MAQIGRFTLGIDQIMDEDMQEPLMSVFGTTVVLEARFDASVMGFRYTAMSSHFEDIEAGEEAPEYEPAIDEQGNVTWEKVDG